MPKARPTGQAVSQTGSMPAPVGGLNARDALAAMKPGDAVAIENWFCQPSYIELRNGYTRWATGMPGWVETLATWESGSTRQMFAWAVNGATANIYNVTASGAVGAAVVSGLTNARWEWTNFGTSGGRFLYAANGVDAPRLYDGTTWTAITGASSPAITGVTTTLLRNPTQWKNRLFFIEEGSMRVWYLPTASVGGGAQSIDFSPLFARGGSLRSILTFTFDSYGSGPDELIGFLTSNGELAIYRGTDPASANNFALSGIFRVGMPIGRRPWFRLGADVIMITTQGFQSMTLLLSRGERSDASISYKIENAVQADAAQYRNNFGWQGLLHANGNKIIVNVPVTERSVSRQYVMNASTGAWSVFSNWNAACFEVSGGALYFGGNGFVAQADTGNADDGAVILGKVKPAFSYFGSRLQKQFTMIRPILQAPGSVAATLALCTDFGDTQPTSTPSFAGQAGAKWNVALWNVSYWLAADQIQRLWQSAPGSGFAATVNLFAASNVTSIKLHALDFVYQRGSVL